VNIFEETMPNQTLIGVDLGGTNVRAGLIENGAIVNKSQYKIPQKEQDKEVVLGVIFKAIEDVYTSNVSGIGVGVPGLVDRKTGAIHGIQNIPSFDYIPLKEILEERFEVGVQIDNDANCFALGEKIFGKGRKFENLVGLSVGTGMGAGIINKGELIADSNCGAGEYGEIPYLDGVMEDYCSGKYFKNKASIAGEELLEKAKAGNKEALDIFNDYGYHLGKAIKVVMLTLDPEAIILGGSVSKSVNFFYDAMMAEVHRFVYPKTAQKLKIEVSELKDGPIFGAASLVAKNNVMVFN
jgi:glucokinase